MHAWRSLGFIESDLEKAAGSLVQEEDWWNGPNSDSLDELELWAVSASTGAMVAFALGSMGFSSDNIAVVGWRDAGRRLVRAATAYLVDHWNDKQPEATAEFRKEVFWGDLYRESLAIALALGEIEMATSLIQWPENDIRFDRGASFHTKEDNLYQLSLASCWRSENSTAFQHLETLSQAKNDRPQLLSRAALGVLRGNATMASKHLELYLEFYLRNELSHFRPDMGVCVDATTLYYLALSRGLAGVHICDPTLKLLIATP